MIIYKSCASGYHGQGWVQLCAKELRPLDSVLLKEGQKETLFKGNNDNHMDINRS